MAGQSDDAPACQAVHLSPCNGALHARRAFTLERVFNDTCTISDPYVSVHLYLYPCLFYLSHASPPTYRYSPYVARPPWFRSCTIMHPLRERERERILSLPRLSLLLEPATRTQGYRRRNKRREKEKGSDEGDGRKREKGGGRGGEREKVSGAIIWYPWLVSGSASRRQGRLCWIYL